MDIRATAVQYEVWSHPRQGECGSRCDFQAKDIQIISRQLQGSPAVTQRCTENIIKEIHIIESIPKIPGYKNIDKLNLNLLGKEQLCDKFCKKKVIDIETKPDSSFILDENSILRKAVKLRYSVEPTNVVPRKLTNIILEFHDRKGHQGISWSVNMM